MLYSFAEPFLHYLPKNRLDSFLSILYQEGVYFRNASFVS